MQLTDIDFKTLKLPVHPQALAAILQLDDHTDMNFKELDSLIRVDQGISAGILKLANSSFYSRGNKITSLQNAISLLGFKLIRSMVVLLTTKSLFEIGKYEKFRTHVYRHSVVTAIIAKALASSLGYNHLQEEAFVAGLLHDIGKVILNVCDRTKFIETLNLCLEGGLSSRQAEMQVFGIDHVQVGMAAAEAWKLPDLLVYTISCHEQNTLDTPKSDAEKIALIIRYADLVAKKAGYGFYSAQTDADCDAVAQLLGISPAVREQNEVNQKERLDADPFFKYCTGLAA